jgi:hypothetical protein
MMCHDEYRRLHAACLAMAKQSTHHEVQARWLAMAQAWLRRATEMREPSRRRGAHNTVTAAYR